MLKIQNCENNGGFILWGDYSSLQAIHSFIMDISEKSPVLNEEGLTVALAYDLRKAFENQREREQMDIWEDTVTIYGVEQVWPTFVIQIALLRNALSFSDSSKLDQSIMYQLEACLFEAFATCLPAQALKLEAVYNSIVGIQEHEVDKRLGSRVSYFLSSSPKKRATQLSEVLLSLEPMFDHFPHNDKKRLAPKDFNGHSWDTLPDTEL